MGHSIDNKGKVWHQDYGGEKMGIDSSNLLRKIEEMQRELEYMKRDLMHLKEKTTQKPSLFGSVSGEDITDEMIEKAKRELFRQAEED